MLATGECDQFETVRTSRGDQRPYCEANHPQACTSACRTVVDRINRSTRQCGEIRVTGGANATSGQESMRGWKENLFRNAKTSGCGHSDLTRFEASHLIRYGPPCEILVTISDLKKMQYPGHRRRPLVTCKNEGLTSARCTSTR
jgi:hypothetical protein